jgi:ubiquinol-cytochrome c reductase cytochrome c1 subunit
MNMMLRLSKAIFASLFAALMVAVSPVSAAGGSAYPLDQFPMPKLTDQAALQNGAKLFVNYCLNCHSANSMRYNRLQDIGLTDEQIRANLLFTAEKVGEPMKTAMRPKDAIEWFGALPPDLSVIARARSSHAGTGSDWLYTYLRAYYRDNTRATGWNNAVFSNVGMPHVLWEMQGARGAVFDEVKEVKDEKTKASSWVRVVTEFATDGTRSEKSTPHESNAPHASTKITLTKAEGGQLDQATYDSQIADLVAYITYMSDPSAKQRTRLGVWVILFLMVFTFLAWNLNRVYWKDIK